MLANLKLFTVIAQPQTIRMPIDHFNQSDTRTYANRFWVNETFYKPGGPVIMFDWGEQGVTDDAVVSYFDRNASNMALAERYNGLAIIWEHRFYGM